MPACGARTKSGGTCRHRVLTGTCAKHPPECVICFHAGRPTTFACGHVTCIGCRERVLRCPFCRASDANAISVDFMRIVPEVLSLLRSGISIVATTITTADMVHIMADSLRKPAIAEYLDLLLLSIRPTHTEYMLYPQELHQLAAE